jgi:hypothetical protein
MTALSMANFNNAMKTMYAPGEIPKLGLYDHPLLAMIKKNTKWGGESYKQPIQYANNVGRSATLTAAKSASGNAKFGQFVIPLAKKDYAVIQIDGEVVRSSSMGDATSYLTARKSEIDASYEGLYSSLGNALYRNGGGAKARVATLPGGNVITFTNSNDVAFFEVGMVLQAQTTDGTSAGTLRVGTMTVTAVNRDEGASSITCGGGTVAALAVNDFLFQNGDIGLKITGLDRYIPATAPTDTLYGVNRALDSSRLGGLRYNASLPLLETIQRSRAYAAKNGAKITHYFMHPDRWADLELQLDNKATTDLKSADEKFGYTALSVRTPAGVVPVIADADCPIDVCWGLKLDDWTLLSKGDCPGPIDHSEGGQGNYFKMMEGEDTVEGRIGYYAELACRAPGNSIRVAV